MLRLNDVCDLYKISKPTVYVWIDKGLPVHYVGKIPFFDEQEVNQFIKAGGNNERQSIADKT